MYYKLLMCTVTIIIPSFVSAWDPTVRDILR